MIAAGDQIKTIADKLSISPNTVHTYRARLKDKMNLATDVEMTRYAMLNDLVE
jgi:DNA-binding NarL/FixJ family response regulator